MHTTNTEITCVHTLHMEEDVPLVEEEQKVPIAPADDS